MVNLHVLAVLEHVFCVAREAVHIDIAREHERISAVMQADMLQFQAVNSPESLVSIVDFNVFKRQILHLSEELRPVDDRVFHGHITAIPNGRTAFGGEIAIRDEAFINVPPRIFAIELRVVAH